MTEYTHEGKGMKEEMEKTYLEVFADVPQVKGFFATRYGACQGSPYYHEGVLKEAGLEQMQLIQPRQVHKDRIAVIEKRGKEPMQLPDTDGMITNVPGVLLTTVHADCLPVCFFDPEKKAIGLVHAGWRGTAAGIASKAVTLMERTYGSRPSDLLVYIGPGISRCCFETGPEVAEEFREKWSFAPEFFEKKGEKYYIDLKGINKRQLTDLGVKASEITVSPHCTCCESELFCSYRRDGGTYLRMGAGLCLTE